MNPAFSVIFFTVMSGCGYGLLFLLGCLFVEHVFARMGAGPAILPVIGHYMMTWYAGMPFLALMMIGNSVMRAIC